MDGYDKKQKTIVVNLRCSEDIARSSIYAHILG